MPISPLITFKAGQCAVDTESKPYKVTPEPEPGYIYLYNEEDLTHFCWRRRDESMASPTLDLVMVPTDGSFVPYENATSSQPSAKTNGRVFVLKFASSSQRHLFWLQSKPQSRNGDPGYFSPRDRKIGEIVNSLLQGEEVDVTREIRSVRNVDDRPDDDDEAMEDVEGSRHPHDHRGSGSGGAGPDATGGDVREEGEESREGGGDGARAMSNSLAGGSGGSDAATAAVNNLLASLNARQGQGQAFGGSGGAGRGAQEADIPYPFLTHLLPSSMTVPMVDAATEEGVENLLNFLPPSIIVLASSPGSGESKSEPTADELAAAKASLSLDDKRSLLKKVLRSPQFHQALASLTMALRDGGLPGIADALGVKVDNGGYLQGGGMPLGGGQAVKAFVDGIKKNVQEKKPEGS